MENVAFIGGTVAFPGVRGGRTAQRRALLLLVVGLVASSLTTLGSAEPAVALGGDFDHPYLDGVSGPQANRSVDLAGTWEFQPVMDTTCHNTGYPLGPQTGCVDTPLSQQTTIRVPGGGWVKQGYPT